MFTPTKRTVTALIITAYFLTPISANAALLDQQAGTAALSKGRILSVSEDGDTFWIEYKGQIILCMANGPNSGEKVFVTCWDQL